VTTAQRPSILMLGTDRYAMRACLEHDIDAVVVWGPGGRDNGFVDVPDGLRVLPVDDQSSVEAILMALHRAGLAGHRFDGVQTTDEYALVTASLLAAHLGCDFPDPGTAVHFRDKSLQKKRVRAAGLKAARATVIEDVHDVTGIDELPYAKAVLKPIAGAGTTRTSVVESVQDLRARSEEYRKARTKQRTFALEEFVTGDEWTADGILFDGELLFCSFATYGEPCVTTVSEGLSLSLRRFDPDRDRAVYELGLPVVRRALQALGLRNGVFHMELFHDPATGELAFSECAARRGGVLVHEELQAKFQVNLAESAVLCAIGRRPEPVVKTDPRVIGGGFLMGRPGTLVKCPTPAEITARPGVLFARVERPYGAHVDGELSNTNQRIAQCLVAADSEEEFADRLASVRAWFDEQVVVLPDVVTNRELRDWRRRTWPDADFGDTSWA
jgi:biotin carboxylase